MTQQKRQSESHSILEATSPYNNTYTSCMKEEPKALSSYQLRTRKIEEYEIFNNPQFENEVRNLDRKYEKHEPRSLRDLEEGAERASNNNTYSHIKFDDQSQQSPKVYDNLQTLKTIKHQESSHQSGRRISSYSHVPTKEISSHPSENKRVTELRSFNSISDNKKDAAAMKPVPLEPTHPNNVTERATNHAIGDLSIKKYAFKENIDSSNGMVYASHNSRSKKACRSRDSRLSHNSKNSSKKPRQHDDQTSMNIVTSSRNQSMQKSNSSRTRKRHPTRK